MVVEKRSNRAAGQMQQPGRTVPKILARRWRWVAFACVLCLCVGGIFAVARQPQYMAAATVRLLSDKPIAIFSEIHPTADEAVVRAQYYVLRSPRIMEPVVQRLNLAGRWNTDSQGAVDRLRDTVSTRRLTDADIVELRATDADPQLAADIANTVVDVYASQANQPRYQQAKSMLASLRQECDEQSKQLDAGEQNIQRLRRDIGLTMGQPAIGAGSANSFHDGVAQADAEAIDAQIRVESLQRLRNDPVVALQAANDTVAMNLATQLTEAQATLATLQHRYGDNHPRVQAARENVAFLATAADQHIDQTIEKVQSEAAAAQTKASQMRQQIGQNSSTNQSGEYAELLEATQRQDVQRDLQKILSERAEKLTVDLQLPSPAAEMIEPAAAPAAAELTPMQILFASVVLGIAIGILLAVTVDRFDNTIREADELLWQLNLPILGTVGKNAAMLRPTDGGEDVEAYRMIRNSIDFANHNARTICVTAAAAEEGVSTTVSNLAWTWAEQGARVLVIDADLQNSTTHAIFGVSNQNGLVDYLRGRKQLNELVQTTPHENISVVCAGIGAVSNPAPLTPQHLSELLTWAKSQADIILFDTGAALAASDTAIIARGCDASVLVIRRSRSSARDLRRCVHVLQMSGTNLLGAIMTAAEDTAWDPHPMTAVSSEQNQAAEQPMQTRLHKKDAA